jgi:lipopolysaccharide export system protein LptA
LAAAGFGERLIRGQKLITALVAGVLAATTLTIAATYWWNAIHRERTLPTSQTLPADVHQQVSGYSFTRSEKGRRIFTVHAARTVAFKQGGATVLEDVFVELFGKTGDRHDVLRTRQCEYNSQSGDLVSRGKVEIELNAEAGPAPGTVLTARRDSGRAREPVVLETSNVSFQQRGSMAVSDEPVRFRVGRASGSAVGMTYATQAGWLELTKEVVLELDPRGGAVSDGPMRLKASRLRYDKKSGNVALGGPLEITKGSRRVLAQQGAVTVNGQNRVTRAILEGQVKALDSSAANAIEGAANRIQSEFDPASGRLRTLQADGNVQGESSRAGNISRIKAEHLEMAFVGAPPRPQGGSASGKVELTIDSSIHGLAAGAADPKFSVQQKSLAAAEAQFVFRPGGGSLQEIKTVGAGKIIIVPADPKVGRRVMTAGQLILAFDGRSRLEALTGLDHSRVVFEPAPNAPPGTPTPESSSERLEASFDPTLQTLQVVKQVGDFRFREGDRQGSADQGHYTIEDQVLALIGHPKVWDSTTRTGAERIVFDLPNGRAEGLSRVQSTHFEGIAPEEAVRRPPVSNAKSTARTGAAEPTNVLADRMVADRATQVVHYEGHVRAWSGRDVIEASSLDIYRAERRVSSGLHVVTLHLQPAAPAAGSDAVGAVHDARPVTIRADRLEYIDRGRRARYDGNVELQTENTTLQADRLDVYFKSSDTVESSDIERAVADGHVTVAEPGRRAKGEHAEYFAAAGKIMMTGGRPSIYDEEKGWTTGQRLTFFIHDDSLSVDGGGDSPALSKHRVAQ